METKFVFTRPRHDSSAPSQYNYMPTRFSLECSKSMYRLFCSVRRLTCRKLINRQIRLKKTRMKSIRPYGTFSTVLVYTTTLTLSFTIKRKRKEKPKVLDFESNKKKSQLSENYSTKFSQVFHPIHDLHLDLTAAGSKHSFSKEFYFKWFENVESEFSFLWHKFAQKKSKRRYYREK